MFVGDGVGEYVVFPGRNGVLGAGLDDGQQNGRQLFQVDAAFLRRSLQAFLHGTCHCRLDLQLQ